jgi:hypothetical protein
MAIPGKCQVDEVLRREDKGSEEAWYRLHAQAYALGNKLVAPAFKWAVVETMAPILERYGSLSASVLSSIAEIVYGGTCDINGLEIFWHPDLRQNLRM